MKDHEVAKLVNDLTAIAKECAGTQQLRQRISQRIETALGRECRTCGSPGSAACACLHHEPMSPAVEVLTALDERLRSCFGRPITAEDAYDTMYQDMAAAAIKGQT